VTEIEDYAFISCRGFTGVTLPKGITTINRAVFSQCKGLAGTLIIPDGVVTIEDSAFLDCESLEEIVLPASFTSFEKYSFSGLKSLTAIEVSEQNRNYTSVNGILYNKQKTEIIFVPRGIQRENFVIPEGVLSIGEKVFAECRGLTGTLTIADSVTSIGKNAFYNCRGLTGVRIPASVKVIEDNAFQDCTKLVSAGFLGDAPEQFGSGVFRRCSKELVITYDPGKSGWSTPEWNDYQTVPRSD